MDEISDSRLQWLYRLKIAESADDMKLLKSQLYCGSQVTRNPAGKSMVLVLANNETARIHGTTTCKNSWACPVCSAKNMARYATNIACAIEAMKKWYNQTAVMITFTIPHTRGMTCEETTEILYNTWKDFMVHGNKRRELTDDKGKRRWKGNDVFSSFCGEFNCKHRVRVAEYTWGRQGWHPHFHTLFWLDTDKYKDCAEWEEKLLERWLVLAKRNTVRQWDKMFPEKKANGDNQKRADIMYGKLNKVSKAVYISKDENGVPIAEESSVYITGWGADKELTGNYQKKASHKGHYTPRQILEKALEILTTSTNSTYPTQGQIKKKLEAERDQRLKRGRKPHEDEADFWLELYMEYARATRKYRHARLNFSTQSGIHDIIARWKMTNEYLETLKKNATHFHETAGNWRVVVSFGAKLWSNITFLDRQRPMKAMILSLAREPDGRKKIMELLTQHHITFKQIDVSSVDPLIKKSIYDTTIRVLNQTNNGFIHLDHRKRHFMDDKANSYNAQITQSLSLSDICHLATPDEYIDRLPTHYKRNYWFFRTNRPNHPRYWRHKPFRRECQFYYRDSSGKLCDKRWVTEEQMEAAILRSSQRQSAQCI